MDSDFLPIVHNLVVCQIANGTGPMMRDHGPGAALFKVAGTKKANGRFRCLPYCSVISDREVQQYH